MRIFDTDVQKLKYEVLKQVAQRAYEGALTSACVDVPKLLAPGPKATMRCCIYKERAILGERVKIALGGEKSNPRVIETIPIACDECPVSGYQVTHNCRGCIAHRCMAACPKQAISIDEDRRARIDPAKCVGCGRCAAVCPYSAIQNHRRPCENACKAHAIHMGEDSVAAIDGDKCTDCGACAYQCPFGAVQDKCYLPQAIELVRQKESRVYAVVAPSISSQFRYAKLGQVVAALRKLGFHAVVEAALGADMTALAEARELAEKGALISSCCPAFVRYVQTEFPDLLPLVSHTPSPMAMLAAYLKRTDPGARVVFIGPCTAKKQERERPEVAPYVDCVLTFEELQAWLDSRDFDVSALPEDVLDNASYYGRIFARSGGLSEAVAQALREQQIDFEAQPVVCDGLEACRAALLQQRAGRLPGNFIEGMACVGGCIGGAGCLTHGPKDKGEVDRYGMLAMEKKILEAAPPQGF